MANHLTPSSVIIFGLSPQGLFLLREYSNLGLRVYAVGRKDDVGIKSRHGRISVMHEDSDLVRIANEILSLGVDNSLAFITSDYFLQLICNSHPGLLRKFEFTISSIDTLLKPAACS